MKCFSFFFLAASKFQVLHWSPSFSFLNDLFTLCVWVFARMNVHPVHAWCPQRSIEDTEYLGTGVVNSYWAATWFLGTKPEPSTRKTNTLSFWVISPARVLVGRGTGQKSASGGISQELATATMAYLTGVHLSASLHWGMGVDTPGSIFFFVQSEIKIYFHFSTCRHQFSWHHFVGETVLSNVCFWHLYSKWGECICWFISGSSNPLVFVPLCQFLLLC